MLLLVLLLLRRRVGASVSCPNSCSGHGYCDAYKRCTCADGFTAADCSERTCPYGTAWAPEPEAIVGDDDAHPRAECSNKGLCDRDAGVCTCQEGFEGAACDRRKCENDCSGRGVCQSLEYFASRADPGDGTVYDYTGAWDAEMMWGCVCYLYRDLYSGHDCSVASCPVGDDPLTTDQVNEVQQITCEASAGSATLAFKNEVTRPLAWDATRDDVLAALLELPTLATFSGDEAFVDEIGLLPEPMNNQASKGALGVEISSTTDRWCDEPGVKTTIRFYQEFGEQPLLVADTSLLERESPPGSAGKLSIVKITPGSKEAEPCSNRGICNRVSGQCECDQEAWASSDGYGLAGSRGDCGMPIKTISDCPGEVACNNHGECSGSPTYRCTCQHGWSGADCSEMTCPRGRTWFSRPTDVDAAHAADAECSDMGICDTVTGTCACAVGFSGSACEYLTCPADASGVECGGHGECMTMAQLALVAGFTYGADPNDPYTWDRTMVRGCRCDTGFTGYACSLHTCTDGDDPITPQIESVECSNRGACDRTDGTCDCFTGFGASDGAGGKGTIDDCGYVLPLVPSSVSEDFDIADSGQGFFE
ncbi:hypothetical protein CTAYLR_002443 [Chrysophaeum taylorii]|uniref:EGF-like domain-containing protein n=1 Tax=Chrysophaeum taylorii TaxID=2483200 RepID=A0AAD7XMK7_9STRA|nr:hypothetical protein CTAYLR_002443 [Chrysophaeum taylorii]